MGFYVNPPADAFKALLRSKTYIDKSGLIAYTNQVIETSRMLTAYYSKGADSRELFEDLEIAGMKDARYLAYDMETEEVFIPNEEVRNEFVRAIREGLRPELAKAVWM